MQQIWTNPSLQRSFIATNLEKTSVENFLRLVFNNNEEILIFSNMEYQFVFYDAKLGVRRSVTGLVAGVYEDQIKIKVLDSSKDTVDCAVCGKRHTCKGYNQTRRTKVMPPMPTCNCVLNPPETGKYDGPVTYFIPVANLIQVSYVKTNPIKPRPKEDTKVMIIGFSATTLKAIILHLEFFDDSVDHAVKYVDIQKDGIYNITYEGKGGTIFEIVGKVCEIRNIDGRPPKPFGPAHENVGFYNEVYKEEDHTKDVYMREPPVKNVEIVLDTSTDFSGDFEVIRLDSIRDCELIQAPDGVEDAEGTVDTNECCCTMAPPKPLEYDLNEDTKAVVYGDKVDIFIKGEKSETTIDELLKFYLAI